MTAYTWNLRHVNKRVSFGFGFEKRLVMRVRLMLGVSGEVCGRYFGEIWFSCGFGSARQRVKSYGWAFSFFHLHLSGLVFIAMGLSSSCSEQGLLSGQGVRPSHCSGFSCGAQALGHSGFSSCGPWDLEHRLSSCDAQA